MYVFVVLSERKQAKGRKASGQESTVRRSPFPSAVRSVRFCDSVSLVPFVESLFVRAAARLAGSGGGT